MFQRRTHFFSKIISIVLACIVLVSTTPIYAYNYEDYEVIEERIAVDNKHNSPSHVNLYILSEKLQSGYFSYNFYQTDGGNYYSDAVTTPLIYHTRVENLKTVKTFPDGSYLYMVSFGIENGKYVFSNNFCIDATTLTPDYKNPLDENPIDTTNGNTYLASYAEYFVDVADETINVYCSLGSEDWNKTHLENLISYAKEHDTPSTYTPDTSTIDTSDVDALRAALSENGYEGDLLDDFLDELEKEEELLQTEATETSTKETDVINTANSSESSEIETEEDFQAPTPIQQEEEKTGNNILAWIITVAFFIVFGTGCIWQKKKKANEK